jgi:hypothetical protein
LFRIINIEMDPHKEIGANKPEENSGQDVMPKESEVKEE